MSNNTGNPGPLGEQGCNSEVKKGPPGDTPPGFGGEAVPTNSAFHEDNISRSTLIMLVRIYEAQMALLFAMDPEAYQMLHQDHLNGEFNSPPPKFVE